MAELSTIARPYAQAVFELAVAEKNLKHWSETLNLCAMVAQDNTMIMLIGSARIGRDELVDVFIDVCGEHLDNQGQNMIRVLAENGRLNLLTEIAAQYERLRAEAEKTVEAEMVSAYPVKAKQQADIEQALKKRLGREVNLSIKVDQSLIGGAIIRAGDLVIDGSLKERLGKLAGVLGQ